MGIAVIFRLIGFLAVSFAVITVSAIGNNEILTVITAVLGILTLLAIEVYISTRASEND